MVRVMRESDAEYQQRQAVCLGIILASGAADRFTDKGE